MGGFGTNSRLGTAEYYANSGTSPQPGCSLSEMSLADTRNILYG